MAFTVFKLQVILLRTGYADPEGLRSVQATGVQVLVAKVEALSNSFDLRQAKSSMLSPNWRIVDSISAMAESRWANHSSCRRSLS